MPIEIEEILVIDLEATCWPDSIPPKGEISEVIELGVCRLNVSTGAISDKRKVVVKPADSKVSDFCTELTGLTQEQVESGIGFMAAMDVLTKDYLSRNHVWASWGDYDRVLLQQQCERTYIEYPFRQKHLNISTLNAIALNLKKEIGICDALLAYGLEFEGRLHNGADDAFNSARVLGHLIKLLQKG
ncbi:3'-5' exonuclease [Moorena sp. SIO3A2]|uniref:3'-5' exonuclease n=1 Tax=Moorena sp. SIO3A2 TaxID=2607841 RepID=UPI0013B946C2|nr:3'-5' exonuclease [Moorena sp. SIO3A2]NER90378.1 exonuclease domain-containing protein [Moorena sp. SIO3A2]